MSLTQRWQCKHWPTGHSLLAHGQSKPSAVGVSSARSPCLADGSVPHQSLMLVLPEVGVSPTRRRQRKYQPTSSLSISPRVFETLRRGVSLARSSYSAARIFPSQILNKFAGIVMGLPLLGSSNANLPTLPTQPCWRWKISVLEKHIPKTNSKYKSSKIQT